MTGARSPQAGDFPGNADKGKTALQHTFDGAGQLGDAEDFLLGGVEVHGENGLLPRVLPLAGYILPRWGMGLGIIIGTDTPKGLYLSARGNTPRKGKRQQECTKKK
ncbi:MAG: hypothetical protein D3925_19130 [Candidatus Electrothrix sp. AR5]|nr:hypothetical protein [Candidatus Electrothrix sp. AR5]